MGHDELCRPSAASAGELDVEVGGSTAIFQDLAGAISSKLPLFIGIVVGLSFLLLMAVLRSLVIPLTAAVMNLLSVGAAFGVVTAVLQWGWGAELIGVDRTGPIRTITAAAAIMVLVFGAFILGGERVIKLFGLGLASAVLFDALIIRSVLVPGLLLLVGKANWWLPAWPDRRPPHLDVEGSGAAQAEPAGRPEGRAEPRVAEPA